MSTRQHGNPTNKHRSWRYSPSGSAPSVKSWRWIVSLAAIALLVLFVSISLPGCPGERHLIAISVWNTDGVLPPIAYADNDVQAIAQLDDVPKVEYHNWTDLQDSGSFGRFSERLEEQVAATENDVLILYLNAHGMSDEKSAYLVCSDFLRNGSRGRYDTKELINAVEKSRAGLKLIILDCGRIAQDPRLGMLVNEFPKIIEQQLMELAEQDLWVLLSNSTFETSALNHGAKRGEFGLCLADALAGKADERGTDLVSDGYVSLQELYRYVRQNCKTQSPVLLRARDGRVDDEKIPDDKKYRLILVSAKQESPTPPSDGDKKSPGADSEHPESPDTKKGSDKQPTEQKPNQAATSGKEIASGENKPASSSEAAADGDQTKKTESEEKNPPADGKLAVSDSKERLATLSNAWKLRDDLKDRNQTGGISPVDFAPHHWRALNARLLYYEQFAWSGNKQPSESKQQHSLTQSDTDTLKQIVTDLENLQWSMHNADQLSRRNLTQESKRTESSQGEALLDAWTKYRNSPEKASFDKPRQELIRVRDAVRVFHDMVFDAVDLVHWHAQADLTSSEYRDEDFDVIDKFLDALWQFQNLHVEFIKTNPISKDRSDELLKVFDEAVRLRDDCRKRFLDSIGSDPAAPSDGRESIDVREIEARLSTPRLDGERRRQLIEQLSLANKVSANQVIEPQDLRAQREKRVDRRVALQNKLLRLRGRPLADSIQKSYESLPTLLPKSEVDGTQSHDGDERVSIANILSLIDSRDVGAGRPPADQFWFPEFAIELSEPYKIEVSIPSHSELLSLAHNKTEELVVTVRATSHKVFNHNPKIELEYDHELLKVAEPNVQQQQRTFEHQPDGWYSRTYEYSIGASKDKSAAGRSVAEVKFSVHASNNPNYDEAASIINVELPEPNRIDLIVRRTEREQNFESNKTVSLQLFPNRGTQFEFLLVNKSGEPKSVTAQLYALPLPQSKFDANVAAGRIAVGDRTARSKGEPLGQDRLIGMLANPIDLPGDANHEPVKISFAADAPMPAKNDQPASDGSPAPKDPAAPPEAAAIDVTYGLFCVITNAKQPDEKWIKWIELEWLRPKDYLDAEIGYHVDQRVMAKLSPKHLGDGSEAALPLNGPIPVDADFDGEKVVGKLVQDKAWLPFSKDARPDGSESIVNLMVDQYPRAFLYRVDCLKPEQGDWRPGQDLIVDRPKIRIMSVEAPGYSRAFYFHDRPALPTDEEKKAGAAERIFLGNGETAVIPASYQDFEISLQADTAVVPAKLDDLIITVEFINVSGFKPVKLYSVRDQTAQAQILPTGAIEFRSTVGDWKVPINLRSLTKGRVSLKAEMKIVGVRPDRDSDDSVLVQFDADAPTIMETILPSELRAKETVKCKVRILDDSGVEKIEYQFTGRDAKTFDEKVPINVAQFETSGDVHEFKLALPAEPGEKLLFLRAFDKVSKPSTIEMKPLVIEAPPPVLGDIKGFVRFEGKTTLDLPCEVQLTGPKNMTITSGRDGSFLFKDLPLGKYEIIVAKGFLGNKLVAGKLSDVEPSSKEIILPVKKGELKENGN